MQLPRIRLKLRILLLLPPFAALLMIAADRLTAKPPVWYYGVAFEFDVVDARDKRPIKASVTRSYFGPLSGEDNPGPTSRSSGSSYGKYRGMSRDGSYGGMCCAVRHLPRTLFLRKHDLWITEAIRFRVEARGYEPFDFVPVDIGGKPLAFDTPDIPVFRIELRPIGMPDVRATWSTRPELELDTEYLERIRHGPWPEDEESVKEERIKSDGSDWLPSVDY
jgi:hypothetical protein